VIKREWIRSCGNVGMVFFVLAFALGATAASAQQNGGKTPPPPKPAKAPPPKPGPGPYGYGYPTSFIERHAKRLELSEETVKALRGEVEKSRRENERLRKEVEAAQLGLRRLLEQDLPDEKAVMAQADKLTALVGEQRKNQLRSAIKVRSMLTPKQRAELEKIRKEQVAPRRAGAGGPPPPGKRNPPPGTGPHGKQAPPKPAQ